MFNIKTLNLSEEEAALLLTERFRSKRIRVSDYKNNWNNADFRKTGVPLGVRVLMPDENVSQRQLVAACQMLDVAFLPVLQGFKESGYKAHPFKAQIKGVALSWLDARTVAMALWPDAFNNELQTRCEEVYNNDDH